MKIAKNKSSTNRLKYLKALLAAAPFLASVPVTLAQDAGEEATVPTQEPTSDVSGTLALMVDTHFVSYGFDVWGSTRQANGDSDWGNPLFHPSLELGLDLGSGFKGILGTWWDVNNNATSSIADAVQEVDVWIGGSYSVDKFGFTALYQNWMYANQNEQIVDLKATYAHFLNPSLLLHCRTACQLSGSDDGVIMVLGIAPGKSFGDLSLSFPVNFSYEATENFHGGDSGWGYASVGTSASYPLKFITKGKWSASAGLLYYFTNDDVIPGNVDENFLTGSVGLTLAF